MWKSITIFCGGVLLAHMVYATLFGVLIVNKKLSWNESVQGEQQVAMATPASLPCIVNGPNKNAKDIFECEARKGGY